MSDLKLKIGLWNYDRTRALTDGTVKIDGVNASFESARIVSEIFERMIRQREFDVSELGLTYYLRTLDLDDQPFIALPVFPNRCFRHSAIFINTSSGIEKPQDLAGKGVAMEQYRTGMIFNNLGIIMPWFSQLLDEDRRLLGDDWWPYGVEANRKTMDT